MSKFAELATLAEPCCSLCGCYGDRKYGGYCSMACQCASKQTGKGPRVQLYNGYIYFIGLEQGSAIKIGRAKDIRQRIRSLQCGSPSKLRILGYYCTPNAVKSERAEHIRWASQRLSPDQEWFVANSELLNYIQRVCRAG